MLFEELLEAAKLTENHRTSEITVSEQWTQGRTVYGGLSAGLICRAMTDAVVGDRQLRSLNVGFAGPLLAGKAFHIEVEILREGRTISQVMGRAVQDGGVAVQVQAVFGIPLNSSVNVSNVQLPQYQEASECESYIREGQPGPGFLNNMDMLLAEGSLPFSGSESLKMGGWMRLKESQAKMTVPHLVCLIDCWPPTILPWLKEFAPGSTVNWSLQFVHPLPELNGSDYLGYQSTINTSNDGFGYTSAKTWSPSGELVALSEQTVIVYG